MGRNPMRKRGRLRYCDLRQPLKASSRAEPHFRRSERTPADQLRRRHTQDPSVPPVKCSPSGWRHEFRARRYAEAEEASRVEAGTALVPAHARRAAISSARVVESGTVCAMAFSRCCVESGFFSE